MWWKWTAWEYLSPRIAKEAFWAPSSCTHGEIIIKKKRCSACTVLQSWFVDTVRWQVGCAIPFMVNITWSLLFWDPVKWAKDVYLCIGNTDLWTTFKKLFKLFENWFENEFLYLYWWDFPLCNSSANSVSHNLSSVLANNSIDCVQTKIIFSRTFCS